MKTTLPVLVLAGPTASGKSALALEWAERWGAEIVGADSQQVYRYFDIGTAKPSLEELGRVPHHLISVVEPTEAFSAARYQTLADAAIEDIQGRGKRVLVVGGTGLYIRILLHGVVPGPPALPEYRAHLTSRAQTEGWPALHRELATVDPETASSISPRDPVRIVRGLEFHKVTGVPVSQHRRAHAFMPDRHRFCLRVLIPDREILYARIEARTREMFRRGLLQEVQTLKSRGYRETGPMKSVGYREALEILEGRLSLEDGQALIAQRTRNYAKRQLTWFRKEASAKRTSDLTKAQREEDPWLSL